MLRHRWVFLQTLDAIGFTHQFEFTAIQAGEGGTVTDAGNNTEEDYFRLRYGLDFNIGFTGLNFTAVHKRFSCARNERHAKQISMTGYHVKWVIGSQIITAVSSQVVKRDKASMSLMQIMKSRLLV